MYRHFRRRGANNVAHCRVLAMSDLPREIPLRDRLLLTRESNGSSMERAFLDSGMPVSRSLFFDAGKSLPIRRAVT